jgi:electron transfer flavoprotein beta subunit
MKVLVSVKRVVDFNVKVRVKPDGTGVETANVKMSMNPFDEIAVEAAVRLKEAGRRHRDRRRVLRPAGLPGDAAHRAGDRRRQGSAGGDETRNCSRLAVAKLLKAVIAKEAPQLVILGKQAIDDDSNQTGQMLAAQLGWSQATFASKIVLEKEKATVTREVDGGLETIAIKLPAVVTTDLRLNERATSRCRTS